MMMRILILARTMWHWLVAAAILFVLELLAPGTFMLWLGLSAMVVGVVRSEQPRRSNSGPGNIS